MRPALLNVLALWLFCMSTRGWAEEQGTREQGMLEQSTVLPRWGSTISSKQWKPKGRFLLDIADMTDSDNHALHYFNGWKFSWCRHVLCMLHWGHSHRLRSCVSDLSAKQYSLAQHNALPIRSHNRYAHMSDSHWLGDNHAGSNPMQGNDLKLHVKLHSEHILPHEIIRGAMRRMSLLDVVDGTDKQANSVRRQGIDSALLRYAGLTLSADTQTGAVYNVGLPPSLAGIRAQVTRINPSTFMQADFMLNEFTFPMNASFDPSGDFVALVYREITSFTVYTLPPEYQYGGPVVGIISSSSNSTSIDPSLPPGSISLPTNTYININLPMFATSVSTNALCAFFSSNGSMFVSNLVSTSNVCLSSTLGDFALVIKGSSTVPSTQNMSPPTATAPPTDGSVRSSSSPSKKSSTNWKLVVGATCLALAGLGFLVAITLISIKLTESAKHYLRTRYTGNDEALQDSLVGGSIAPTAAAMRTKPALEIDVARFST